MILTLLSLLYLIIYDTAKVLKRKPPLVVFLNGMFVKCFKYLTTRTVDQTTKVVRLSLLAIAFDQMFLAITIHRVTGRFDASIAALGSNLFIIGFFLYIDYETKNAIIKFADAWLKPSLYATFFLWLMWYVFYSDPMRTINVLEYQIITVSKEIFWYLGIIASCVGAVFLFLRVFTFACGYLSYKLSGRLNRFLSFCSETDPDEPQSIPLHFISLTTVLIGFIQLWIL